MQYVLKPRTTQVLSFYWKSSQIWNYSTLGPLGFAYNFFPQHSPSLLNNITIMNNIFTLQCLDLRSKMAWTLQISWSRGCGRSEVVYLWDGSWWVWIWPDHRFYTSLKLVILDVKMTLKPLESLNTSSVNNFIKELLQWYLSVFNWFKTEFK